MLLKELINLDVAWFFFLIDLNLLVGFFFFFLLLSQQKQFDELLLFLKI